MGGNSLLTMCEYSIKEGAEVHTASVHDDVKCRQQDRQNCHDSVAQLARAKT